jgi:hypothetical protein
VSFPESVERAAEASDEVLLADTETHPYCPAHGWKPEPWRPTLCECKRLFKADREAAAEDRADDERKYGGM